MENQNCEDRKRRSTATNDEKKRKKFNSSSTSSLETSSSQPKKLIDQLFETWKNNVGFSNHSGPSEKEQKTEVDKKFESMQAATKLKKSSLDLKFSELKMKKSKFNADVRIIVRYLSFCLEMFNNAWESVHHVYEEIKNMVEIETSYDQKISDSFKIRSVILQKLHQEKEKLIALSNERENIDIEIDKENSELENSEKILKELKKEVEKLQNINQQYLLNDVEKILQDVNDAYYDLMKEEITLESSLPEETNQCFQDDFKYSQDQQELVTTLHELQKELEHFNTVDEESEIVNARMKEIISKKLNPEDFTYTDSAEKLENTKIKIKGFELKVINHRLESTKNLLTFDSKLNETMKAIDLLELQYTDLKYLDDILVKTNNELKLLKVQRDKTSEEIKLSNNELEELILKQEILDKENIEILREVNDYSEYVEKEELCRTLKLELDQTKKIHNELMDEYKKIKEANSKNFSDYPDLLDLKASKTFEELKIKSKADIAAAEKKEISLKKINELKLKELEKKAEKYRNLVKEMDQDLKLGEKKFSDLENQIHDAEGKLEKEKNVKREAEIKKEKECEKEAEIKKEKEWKKEAEMKKQAELKKELERKKESERKKETEFKKKASPVIIKDETVQIDVETLSLIKTLKEKLPAMPSETDFSNTPISFKKLSQKALESSKPFSPIQNPVKISSQKSLESSKPFSPMQNSVKTSSQKLLESSQPFSPMQNSGKISQKSLESSKSFSPMQHSVKSASQKSTDDVYSFKPSESSQILIDKLFSQYGSQKSNKSPKNDKNPKNDKSPKSDLEQKNVHSYAGEENKNSNTKIFQDLKSERMERQKSSERKFFRTASQSAIKTHKRSKSVPSRKAQ